jgi:hypothetical protein
MDKQKQIQTEELIGIIQGAVGGCATYWASLIAEEVLKYYQPKIPENAVVMTKEEYDKIYEQAEATVLSNIADGGTSCHWCMDKHEKIGYEKGCKETAEKFAEWLKTECFDGGIDDKWVAVRFSRLDEICKEISEGTEDVKNE